MTMPVIHETELHLGDCNPGVLNLGSQMTEKNRQILMVAIAPQVVQSLFKVWFEASNADAFGDWAPLNTDCTIQINISDGERSKLRNLKFEKNAIADDINSLTNLVVVVNSTTILP